MARPTEFIINIGDKFEKLIVREIIFQTQKDGGKRKRFVCDCSCGNKGIITTSARLRGGHTKSCGCIFKDIVTKGRDSNLFKHGLSSEGSETRSTYVSWQNMMDRCFDIKTSNYDRYGGAGITVCRGLQESPQVLIDLIGIKSNDKLTVDRYPIKTGGYWCGKCEECISKGWKFNIRWATAKQQRRNRVDYEPMEAFGKSQFLIDWANEYGMDHRTLWMRLKRGSDLVTALTTPFRKSSKGYKKLKKG